MNEREETYQRRINDVSALALLQVLLIDWI